MDNKAIGIGINNIFKMVNGGTGIGVELVNLTGNVVKKINTSDNQSNVADILVFGLFISMLSWIGLKVSGLGKKIPVISKLF